MTEAVTFLTSVGQAIASMRIYHEGHPARERAIESAFEHARDLLDRDHVPRFTFAEGDVVYHRTLLHELGDWEWAARFETAGIQRLELRDSLSTEELGRFLHEIAGRLAGGDSVEAATRQIGMSGIRYGAVELRGPVEKDGRSVQVVSADMSLSLDQEIEAVEWIHDQVVQKRELPLLEAEVVVRSLAIAINRESQVVLPLLHLKEFDQYTTTHACNVAVLATAFAEHLGFDSQLARTLGVCGLLHDIGKVRIPHDILVKPGRLDTAERKLIEEHPVHGARILLERERNLDLAAVVSYEHHRWMDGGGYPRPRRDIRSHVASRMVQICDVFDALCTDRPYRGGLPPEVALAEIEAESGNHFDPELVVHFARLIRGSMLRFSSIPTGRQEVPADRQDEPADEHRAGDETDPSSDSPSSDDPIDDTMDTADPAT